MWRDASRSRGAGPVGTLHSILGFIPEEVLGQRCYEIQRDTTPRLVTCVVSAARSSQPRFEAVTHSIQNGLVRSSGGALARSTAPSFISRPSMVGR